LAGERRRNKSLEKVAGPRKGALQVKGKYRLLIAEVDPAKREGWVKQEKPRAPEKQRKTIKDQVAKAHSEALRKGL